LIQKCLKITSSWDISSLIPNLSFDITGSWSYWYFISSLDISHKFQISIVLVPIFLTDNVTTSSTSSKNFPHWSCALLQNLNPWHGRFWRHWSGLNDGQYWISSGIRDIPSAFPLYKYPGNISHDHVRSWDFFFPKLNFYCLREIQFEMLSKRGCHSVFRCTNLIEVENFYYSYMSKTGLKKKLLFVQNLN
jgi:hypothetical protein